MGYAFDGEPRGIAACIDSAACLTDAVTVEQCVEVVTVYGIDGFRYGTGFLSYAGGQAVDGIAALVDASICEHRVFDLFHQLLIMGIGLATSLRLDTWPERLLIALVEGIVAVVENTVLTPQDDHKNADGEDEDDCGGKDGDHTVVALFHPV